ncbi:MAG: hypothetical protein JZU53_14170 [Paludibacter sp.]|nr:hypothetical protein [Paludibacter sp.]
MNYKVVEIKIFQNNNRIILSLLFFLSLIISSFSLKKDEIPTFVITTKDSIEYKLYLSLDITNIPQNYKSQIKAPVCEDGLCYDVELIVYWDLVGNFERFEVLPNKPLTKLKHESFNKKEYEKLTDLLSNPSPILGKYKKNELSTKIQQIDGVSGATVTAVKNETIPGAVYTCFTLWHLVHSEAVDSIKSCTKKYLTASVVEKIVAYKNENADYFLVDNLSPEQFQVYLSQLIPLCVRNNWVFVKHFIEKTPAVIVSLPAFQAFFVENYSKLGYFAQVSLLRKLQKTHISKELATTLINHISDNQFVEELTVRIIKFNGKSLNDKILNNKVIELNK